MRFLDEVVQHFLGDFEVSDHAVLHGLDGDDVAGRAAKHFFRLFADRFDLGGVLVDGHDGRLVDDDAFATRVYERVGGPEIDGQVAGENAEERPQIVKAPCAGMESVR